MTRHDLEPLAELLAKQLQELKRLGAHTGVLFELTREISVYAAIGSASLMPSTEPAPMLVALEQVVTICDATTAAAAAGDSIADVGDALAHIDACHDTIRNLRRIAGHAIAEKTKRPR